MPDRKATSAVVFAKPNTILALLPRRKRVASWRKRISRLVTLPDYQGLGIGTRLAERVCEDQTTRGFRISIATSHPAVIAYCTASPLWKSLGIKRLGGTRQQIEGRNVAGSTGRGVASFEWLGERGA